MQKILHNITAASRRGFGIHSPFVFHFQKEILNPKFSINPFYIREHNKVLRMLLRMIAYFDLRMPLLLNSEYRKDLETYNINFSTLPVKSSGYDLVVLDANDFFDEDYLAEEAFVVLMGKHSSMQKNPLKHRCSVFLDMYNVGVCVFRSGLSRQEFKMKL